MKVALVESLHADAGQRAFDSLRVATDDGLVGWSEDNKSSVRVPRRPAAPMLTRGARIPAPGGRRP